MERLTEQHQNNKQTYFFPNHGVFIETRSSTKLTAKPHNSHSLNKKLLVGPSVKQDMFSIICRFRT